MDKLPIGFDLRAISLAEGLRAGIAVAVTLIIGQVYHLPHFGLAALGALLTCFADPGGPIARRTPAVIAFALLGGILYGAFGLLREEGVWIAATVAGLMIFCTSYLRVYGQGGLQVGNLLSVVTVLGLDTQDPSLRHAFAQAVNFCAGAAWAAFLTLVIWRVYPYAPARRSLADIAQKLSRFARGTRFSGECRGNRHGLRGTCRHPPAWRARCDRDRAQHRVRDLPPPWPRQPPRRPAFGTAANAGTDFSPPSSRCPTPWRMTLPAAPPSPGRSA